MSKTELFGVSFDDLTMPEAVERALTMTWERRSAIVVTPNPEILLAAKKNKPLREALKAAALTLPDGVGLVYASEIMGTPLKNRLPGIDFASALMARLAEKGGSVFLLGAKPGIAELAAEKLSRQYPGLAIAGARHGYFSDAEEAEIIAEIQEKSPDLILVCLGSPRQELWMKKYAPALNAGLLAGLGGALDVYAGAISRAPKKWRDLGLEWLYRLLCQPRRLSRVIRLPAILWAAAEERIRRQKHG